MLRLKKGIRSCWLKVDEETDYERDSYIREIHDPFISTQHAKVSIFLTLPDSLINPGSEFLRQISYLSKSHIITMHYLTSTALAIATLTLPTAMGAPRPEGATCAGGSGSHGYTYTVTSQKDVPGDSLVGDYSVSGVTGSKPPFPFSLPSSSHL